jgi:hypothetical protein
MNETVPVQIQDAVDQYMELHQVSKQLEERMKELREIILSFMKEHEMKQIHDKNRTGKVQLSVTERATMTSRYTTYDLAELAKSLNPVQLQKCVVSVVDKEKLDALSKLGEVDADVLAQKTTKPSFSLIVRFDK